MQQVKVKKAAIFKPLELGRTKNLHTSLESSKQFQLKPKLKLEESIILKTQSFKSGIFSLD